MVKNKITILLFNPEFPINFVDLLKMCYPKYSPPLKFLENQQHFGFLMTIKGHVRKISFADIYRISEQKDGTYIHYKDKNEKTGRIIYRRIGPIDKNFKEFFFQPLFEYKAFCQAVSKVVNSIKVVLKNPENELGKLFEDFKHNKIQKIVSVRIQDFQEAAIYRDKEKEAVEKIRNYLRELIPGDDLDEALNYILEKCDEL